MMRLRELDRSGEPQRACQVQNSPLSGQQPEPVPERRPARVELLDQTTMSPSGITIELTRTQIDRVVRGNSQENGVTSVLQGLADQELAAPYASLSHSPRLSRS